MTRTNLISFPSAAFVTLFLFILASCEQSSGVVEDKNLSTSNGKEPTLNVYAVFPPGHGVPVINEQDRSSPYFRSDVEKFASFTEIVGNNNPFDLDTYFRDITLSKSAAGQNEIKVPAGGEGLRIAREAETNIPLVYANNRTEAMFGIGYAHARDRLWQLDVLRNRYRSSLATLKGAGEDNDNIKSDAFWFTRLGYLEEDYQMMFDKLRTEHGRWGKQAHADIASYTRGVNTYIDEISADVTRLPLEYKERKLLPARWRPSDNIALTAGLKATRGFGARELGNSRLLQQLRSRFGEPLGDSIYSDLRLADDPEAPVVIPGRAPETSWRQGFDPTHHVLLDKDSFVRFDALSFDNREDIREGLRNGEQPVDPGPTPAILRSNALLVSGTRMKSGRPVSTQGPQDGFKTPHHENMEIRVEAPELFLRGVLEFRSPYPVNGLATDRFATSSTSQRSDQFDSFVLKLCNPAGNDVTSDAMHYVLKEECIPFDVRRRTLKTLGSETAYTVTNLRSRVGRIVGRAFVDGDPVVIAQASVYLDNEASDYPVYAQMVTRGEVQNAEDFVRIMKRGQLSVIFYYIDHNSIAAVELGDLPDRKASGGFPHRDVENWSWKKRDDSGWIPNITSQTNKPSTVNPSQGFIAGWNNQQQSGWPTSDSGNGGGGFQAGPLARVQLLSNPLQKAFTQSKLSVEDVVRLYATASITDVTTSLLWPLAEQVLKEGSDGGAVSDSRAAMNAWYDQGALWLQEPKEDAANHLRTALVSQEFWMRLFRKVFTDVLGVEIISEIPVRGAPHTSYPGNNLSTINTGTSGWIHLWGNVLHKDFRRLLGKRVPNPLSIPLCGNDDIKVCAQIIQAALDEADGAIPELLDAIGKDKTLEITFPPSGAAAPVDNIPWQNRPVFHLVVTPE